MKSTLSGRLKQTLIDFFCEEKIPLSEKSVFAVCYSGGRDSTSLLKLMNDLAKEKMFSLKAVYVRHNLRPAEECEREETHVRSFCSEEKIPLYVKVIPAGLIRQTAEKENRSPEEVARTERYRIFETLFCEGEAGYFLTAHHRDDNFETVVARFFEGAGVTGLKGIPPKNRFFLRPLLTVPAALLTEYLTEKQIPWIEDSTNTDLSVSRNRYRHCILPFLRNEIPGFESGMNRLILKMREADATLIEKNPYPLTVSGNTVTVDRREWETRDEYEKTEYLRRAIQILLDKNAGSRLSYDFLSELKSTGSGEKFYRGIRIRIDSRSFSFSRAGSDPIGTDFCIDIGRPGRYPFPGGILTSESAAAPSETADFTVDVDVLRPPVFFRSLRYGDDRSGLKPSAARKSVPNSCIGDRNGLLVVFENGTRLTKNKPTLEKNRFFNYYIDNKE